MLVTAAGILVIIAMLFLYLIPIAVFLIALYYIIKAAVKKGILEAEEEKRMKELKNKFQEE
jgi:hypothetical protein